MEAFASANACLAVIVELLNSVVSLFSLASPWMHGEDESSFEDRLAHPTPGRNLWLTYDAARLTAADGAEKRYKAKARQITLGMRIAAVLQNRTLLLDSP